MIEDKKVADIRKESISLITYPYSDPSPVPEFGRLYPYNRFDGYTNTSHEQQWEMIVMENDHIKLWINPAVGGKIWGAIEKATNKEFIYFNHVVKFRDVAMRGPWTSGGMEINIGIIGHNPSCSSPVDYHMRKNDDGSVSCFIGATDWPSRTNWTVEVHLRADAAYFTTRSTCYNNSGLEQSYYQWNNVGVKTTGNLEYINPGYKYIGHDGSHHSWPKGDSGQQISFYDKNDKGEYKSYHIFGSYSDFWGCYWHNDNFGFGHSATYDDKPGKKIWIWGLSRYGMIWEDILTDNDGQYTELQSGRMFNQSIAASSKTPFKHNSFLPYTFDSWDEHWFPVKNIDGLTHGNKELSFYLTENDHTTELRICANQDLNHTLRVEDNNNTIFIGGIVLDTMQTTVIKLPGIVKPEELKISLDNKLIYDAQEQNQQLSRPVTIAQGYNFNSIQAIYIQAKEWERQRFFDKAIEQYQACLKKDPFYIDALCGLASVLIRHRQYNEALKLLLTSLSIDTYHAEANYLFGMASIRVNAIADAKDGFSIATQSLQYRSAAYTELAKIFFKEQQLIKALSYLKKALQYNTQNKQALQLEVIIERINGNVVLAKELCAGLLHTNPLDHLIRFEHHQLGEITVDNFKAVINSEMPYETYLELSAFYFDLGLYNTSLDILGLAPSYPMVGIWKAYIHYLQNESSKTACHITEAIELLPELVFPHREDNLMALEWAVANYSSWKLKYYLALGYTQMLRTEEALELLTSCENEPDFYAFYIVRANLHHSTNEFSHETDLREAYRLAPAQWRTSLTLTKYLAEKCRWNEALDVINKGYLQNPDNYYLGLQLAKCLMHTAAFDESIALMNALNVLPNEGASAGRNAWKETHLLAAIKAITEKNWQQAINYIDGARQWPENMGVGKPDEVDERLENFLELYCLQQNDQSIPINLINDIALYRDNFFQTPYNSNDFLSIYLLQQNNHFDKALSILDSWIKHDPNDLAAQWSAAFIDGDTEKLNIIALIQPQKREPLPYEILFEDRSFYFVKKMHNNGFFKPLYKIAD
jgi:tetratricopeptide (TPR) repeat protein